MKIPFFLSLLLFTYSLNAQEFNPFIDSVDEGACPYECCTYGEWLVNEDTILFEEKDVETEMISSLGSGEKVNAITGDVHVRPLKLIVEKDSGAHKKGETIWLLNYLGEGLYRAWKDSNFIRLDLAFSPYQEMNCSQNSDCWASLEGEYSSTWWAKIRTQTGLVGWSNQPGNFAHKGGCG